MPAPNDKDFLSQLDSLADSTSSGAAGDLDNPQDYSLLAQQLQALIDNEADDVANLANCAALLHQELADISWVGFYLHKHDQLVLGPFQGATVSPRVSLGEAICGTAALLRKAINVADVQQFPGYQVRDREARSEMALPLWREGQLLGVLDITSTSVERFDFCDQQGLETLMQLLVAQLTL
ncbi:MAG: GAF domain-containing protein [Porticoccaceae bacterium]